MLLNKIYPSKFTYVITIIQHRKIDSNTICKVFQINIIKFENTLSGE